MNLDVIELQVRDFKKSFVWYKKIFETLHIEKSHALLKKKGIKVSSIVKVHWGRKFSFNDLEKNKHFVYQENK